MTLPLVVTKSLFQEAPLLFTGVAPPPFERKDAARRMSVIALFGASERSPPSSSSASPSGPLLSMATPLLTSSIWPSSSAVMLATRL